MKKHGKNKQYYRKKRVMAASHPKPSDKVIEAIKIAMAAFTAAIQIKIAMQTPMRKYQAGGATIIGEQGKELVS